MFRIKICGVTCPEDAVAVTQSKADAIGFNFYPPSPRSVSPQLARRLSDVVGSKLLRVGVFVNSPPSDVREIAGDADLDAVQLHGDESPEYLAECKPLRTIKAFRCRDGDLTEVAKFLECCRDQDLGPDSVLLDAFDPKQFGGTGKVIDLKRLRQQLHMLGEIDWILAGGLTAENVGAAIANVNPYGVDTASGVEVAPGIKDHSAIMGFATAADSVFRGDNA